MKFTGYAGYLLDCAVMVTAYIAIICGLFWLWVFIFEKLISKIALYFQFKTILLEFIWDKAKYKRKLAELAELEESLWKKYNDKVKQLNKEKQP